MDSIFLALSPRRRLRFIYLGVLLLSFHYYVTAYVNASVLAQYVPESVIGILYTLGALATIAGLLLLPRELRLFGNFRTLLFLIILKLGATLAFAFASSGLAVSALFILNQALAAFIFFVLDAYLEQATPKEGATGTVRGLFLAAANLALVVSALLGGTLAATGFRNVYLVSALFLGLLLFLSVLHLRIRGSAVRVPDFGKALTCFIHERSLRGVLFASYLLQIYYAFMVIYTPLYLIRHLGLPWETAGLLLSVMLLPFLLFELPIGALADRKTGEKEIMAIGFSAMAFFTVLWPFVENVWLLAVVLFMTRVGAAMVEITTESYFFKKVDGNRPDLISIFRLNSPVSFLVGPLIGSLLFAFFSYHGLFFALGTLMLLGIFVALSLKDTR